MLAIFAICTLLPVVTASSSSGGRRKDFHITAHRYAYNPPRITVQKGDEVHITLSSLDVMHGFFIEGYDIDAHVEPGRIAFKLRHPSQGKAFADVREIVFKANKPGKYRYRCSHTCGTMHPFMQGELIVKPNYPFLAGVGGGIGVLLASMVSMLTLEKRKNKSGAN